MYIFKIIILEIFLSTFFWLRHIKSNSIKLREKMLGI